MKEMFNFELQAQDSGSDARAGVFQTPHGPVPTPVFMPVGTQATVKAMAPADLHACGCRVILANTYHLALRPGSDLVREAGGLHRFENWDGTILTDSGGYQVFSLRDISKITEDGVWFQSYIDGSRHFFSPENVIRMQHDLGADIIMMFDECPPSDAPRERIENAVDRTIRWARRCLKAHEDAPACHGYPQALFGIVQGGTDRELRIRCAREIVELDLPGYAVGGLAVGEASPQLYDTAGETARLLPQNRPRYLMGVGKPEDILECIARGIDMFDCVLPTRNGRNGTAFTWQGKLNLRNACHTRDFDNPIDHSCACPACRSFSRAYIRHLCLCGEILGVHLLTLHNIYFYNDLVQTARRHIAGGAFSSWKDAALRLLAPAALDGDGAEAGSPDS